MIACRRTAALAALAVGISIAAMPIACAADDAAPLQSVIQRLFGSDGTVIYDAPVQDGARTVFGNVRITNPDGKTITMESVSLTGATEAAGTLTIAELDFANLHGGNDTDTAVTIKSGIAHDIHMTEPASVPTPQSTAAGDGKPTTAGDGKPTAAGDARPAAAAEVAGYLSSLELHTIAITDKGQQQATIDAVTYVGSNFLDDTPRHSEITLGRLIINIDATSAATASAAGLPNTFGYQKIDCGLAMSFDWDDAAGVARLSSFVLDARDVGTLKVTAGLGGLTRDAVTALHAAPDPSAQMMKVATLNDVAISFTDASLTGRVLNAAAGAANVSTADYVRQLNAMAPLMLNALQNQPLQNAASKAFSSFLAHPGTLTVSARPQTPPTLETLSTTANSDPTALSKMLNVTVDAQ